MRPQHGKVAHCDNYRTRSRKYQVAFLLTRDDGGQDGVGRLLRRGESACAAHSGFRGTRTRAAVVLSRAGRSTECGVGHMLSITVVIRWSTARANA